MKFLKYILLFFIVNAFAAVADDKDSLKNQKADIENKITKIKDFGAELNYARQSESLAYYIHLYEWIDSLGVDTISTIFKSLGPFVEKYRSSSSSLEELENILFEMQWHINEREEEYNELLGSWRSAWDELAQNEITLKARFNKLSIDCDTVIKRSITALKYELAVLQKDIKFSNEIDALNHINKANIVEVISNFFTYVHKNNFELDEYHIERIFEADSNLYLNSVVVIDSFTNSEFIEFTGKLNKIPDFDYNNHKKSLLKSDSMIYSFLANRAGKRGKIVMEESVFIYNAAPVVKGSFNFNGSDFEISEPFYVRNYPLTKEELSFFLIANMQYNLIPVIKMEQIVSSQREDIQEWYGMKFIGSLEREYIRTILNNPGITQLYKAILEPVPIDADNELIKLSIHDMPDSSRNAASEMAEEFWCELHPRRFLFKYSLGLSGERFGLNSAFDNSNINIAGLGRLSNSLVIAWRFNFTGESGDDTYSDFIGLKFENLLAPGNNESFVHEHYENDSLKISSFAFNSNEISLIFCHRDRIMASAGRGFAKYDIEENFDGLKKSYNTDASYYTFSVGYSQPLTSWLSADLTAKLYAMEVPFTLSGAAVLSISARLPALRF